MLFTPCRLVPVLLVQQLGSSASLQPSAEGVQTQRQVLEPQLLRQGDTVSAVFREMGMLLCTQEREEGA